MSDIKLFRTADGQVEELAASPAQIEKSLQSQIEANMEDFLGVRFLATEYSTGKSHRGRIDSLGIDENGSPVIVEYKRFADENVINQGLFYLDWLLDHQAEFEALVSNVLGQEQSNHCEWSNPRLLCIAAEFTRYDEYAVQQIDRNIDLIRYRRYAEDLLLLELVNATTASTAPKKSQAQRSGRAKYKGVREYLAQADSALTDLFGLVKEFCKSLGDDVQEKELQYYFAYKRLKNFACVEVHPGAQKLLVYVKVSPTNIVCEEGFTRDVRNIGHFGTGDLEITIKDPRDFERAQPLIRRSYEIS